MTTDECRAALREGKRVTSLVALARVAVEDARGLDRASYVPLSSLWVDLRSEVCRVCFAGAVIVGSLDLPPGTEAPRPNQFPWHTEQALMALELLRRGHVEDAYETLDVLLPDWYVSPGAYRFSTWDQMDQLLARIETWADGMERSNGEAA